MYSLRSIVASANKSVLMLVRLNSIKNIIWTGTNGLMKVKYTLNLLKISLNKNSLHF